MKNGRLPTIRPSILSSNPSSKPLVPHNHTIPPTETNYLLYPLPTASSLSSALQHYINSGHPSHGRKIHSHILKIGFKPNTNISIKLLILHIKSSCLAYARQVFDELPTPTLSAYNYMISGYIRMGQALQSLNLIRKLTFSNEKPDGFTFSMILKASTCENVSSVASSLGKQVHAQVVKSDVEADEVLYTVLVDSYVKSGRVDYARRVFDMVLEKNVICSTSMISGYMNQGSVADAEYIFKKTLEKDVIVYNAMIEGYSKALETAKRALEVYINMLRLDFRPTISTFASIIGACSVLSAFESGQQVQAQLMKTEFFTHIKIGSALIDMYSKCGRIETAKEIFESIQRNHISVWNAMMNGLAVHGLALDAFAIFSRMGLEKISPDSITFVGILTACSHCGLVEQGRKFFDLMSCYSIQPEIEHYGAMVDLLGRAGHLDEAYAFIEEMPMEPDVIIWRALLSACRTQRNSYLGEVAIKKIEHLNSGDYVLLSNIYCSVNKWDGAERVRDTMKKNGVRKNGGKSWIEMAGVIHQFKAGDLSHLEREAIYKVLEGLIRRTKMEGFIPKMEFVLMDVSNEEKEENLNYHSEKLALAYGILKTSPGMEIQITKNLRTCFDCHCWMKVVSRLLNRAIIVRDRIRFHRFEGGVCTCGDYW